MRIENSFLPVYGVGERTEQTLWESGITHWDAFDGSVVGPTLADRIEAFIETGRERLAEGDAEFFAEVLPPANCWRLYENFREDACYFDIETTGLSRHRDVVTTVSVHHRGETKTYVRGIDLTREVLASTFGSSSVLVSFNGRRFDAPFLEAAFDLDLSLPHVDLSSACRLAGVPGGLKDVEPRFGIVRERPDLSGRDAVRLWYEYQRGDDDALETLVSYNRADAANLEPLMDAVAARLHEERFATRCGGAEMPTR